MVVFVGGTDVVGTAVSGGSGVFVSGVMGVFIGGVIGVLLGGIMIVPPPPLEEVGWGVLVEPDAMLTPVAVCRGLAPGEATPVGILPIDVLTVK